MGEIGAIGLFASAAMISLAIAAFGSALAEGRTAEAAMNALWRQPEVAGRIFMFMILALAFMEALALFVFALVFVLVGRVA